MKIFHHSVILYLGDSMTIYERIRLLRIQAGMSQDDLARAMGYKDRSMITKIESGKVDISQKKILAFARVLNTTPAYLMGWQEENNNKYQMDLQLFGDGTMPHAVPETVTTCEARIISGGVDKMTPEERERALNIMRAAFAAYFKEDDNEP